MKPTSNIIDKVLYVERNICAEVNKLIGKYLLPKPSTIETKVFYLKIKADYYRYLAKYESNNYRKAAAKNSLTTYKEAIKRVEELEIGDNLRIRLVMNYGVLLNDFFNNPKKELRIAETRVDLCEEDSDELYRSSLVQLMVLNSLLLT